MRNKRIINSVVGVIAASGVVTLSLFSAIPGIAQAAGAGPVLAWTSPAMDNNSYAFAPIPVGTTESATFVLTNVGGGSSGALTLTGGLTVRDIVITSNTCVGRALGPGKSCSVTVEYAPLGLTTPSYLVFRASGKKVASPTVSVYGTPEVGVPT